MNLTAKIYLTEFLAGMFFYGIGIFLITPATDTPLIKYAAIGSMLLVMLGVWIYVLRKRTEKLDERALHNLFKASATTLALVTLFTLLAGLVIELFQLKIILSAGILCLGLALILISHAATFRILEVKGN